MEATPPDRRYYTIDRCRAQVYLACLPAGRLSEMLTHAIICEIPLIRPNRHGVAMSYQEQLDHDLKEAMLARDETRKRTLRLVKAAIAYAQVEKRTAGEQTATLSDAEVLQVFTKQARQRRDSIAEFSKAGRLDLVAEEQAELAILEPYLPRQLDAAEVRAIVQQAIADTGASGPKDMGRVMSAAMARVQGLADGQVVSQLARELLA